MNAQLVVINSVSEEVGTLLGFNTLPASLPGRGSPIGIQWVLDAVREGFLEEREEALSTQEISREVIYEGSPRA